MDPLHTNDTNDMTAEWFNSLPSMHSTRKIDLEGFFVLQDVDKRQIKRKGKGYPTTLLIGGQYFAAPSVTWGDARLAAIHLQTHEPPSLPPRATSQWFRAILDNCVRQTSDITIAVPDVLSPIQTLTRKQRRTRSRKSYKQIILLQRKHGVWNSHPIRCVFA